jgi:hypothetical protein
MFHNSSACLLSIALIAQRMALVAVASAARHPIDQPALVIIPGGGYLPESKASALTLSIHG